MKIAFPVERNEGTDSPVFGHFGSAPFFIVVDSETNQSESILNADLHHQHGQCQPLAALNGHTVDAVVVSGIGAGALRKLHAAGVRVYHGIQGSVSENLNLIQNAKLSEFDMSLTCAGHSHNDGCIH
ncbi:MAG TPA: NifB/NifX family molybdenum-iron cluster-binding protein [Desulfatirhabdiaceae bacterium]|nr:NifB/NifX family molybdenum-iron cluster-binding protein [Desulfatirhabdiaceae bacterium]